MKRIPVTFTHDGKELRGYFAAVSGAGGNNYDLMIHHGGQSYYKGQLNRLTDGWIFTSNSEKWGDLREYFDQVITAWFE